MSVEPGQTLLHYRILDKIGEGGMGVVYRAQDTQLDREVAIKVLPASVSADPERLSRFEREARLLASLSHPGIAAVFGLHESGPPTVRFFAMELVAGEDLASRLSRGPLSVDEALALARSVAEALDAAHQSGVIHRDLKPANVKLAPGGKIKVLDFGLAKAMERVVATEASPTLTSAGSAAGVVMGTAAYMSPEQARGQDVDRRTDIWSFGCLLYELLVGRAPFARRSLTDTLAAVVRDEPDWSALPADTPPRVRTLLGHCLVKDPGRRLRDIGDALLRLDEVDDAIASGQASTTDASPVLRLLPWVLFLVAITLAILALAYRAGPAAPRPMQATWTDLRLSGLEATTNRWGTPPLALSPDGRTIVYVHNQPDETSVLALRSFDGHEHRVLPGTSGADGPFFSPDGEWVGYFTDVELRKVRLSGQTGPETLHRFEVPTSVLGAVWTPGHSIVFGVVRAGLFEVSESGGPTAQLTVPDIGRGEVNHGFPFVLPGGRQLLFSVAGGMAAGVGRPAVFSRDTGQWTTLLPEDHYGIQPHYVASGHLVYSRGDQLLAAPFDLETSELTGPSRAVLDGIHADLGSGVTHFTLSASGALAFMPNVDNYLVWVDRMGSVTPIVDVGGYYLHPRVSPDGKKVALLALNGDVWVVDVERKNMERLTFGGDHSAPLWTIDGRSVTFARNLPDGSEIAMRRADGSGEPVTLMTDRFGDWPMSWSADGRELAFERRTEGGDLDIWSSRPGEPDSTRALVSGPFGDESPRFSPDGHWLAYVSNHSGQYEVYIATWPALDRRWQVSSGGGVEPAWTSGGSELIYRNGRRVLAVSVTSSGHELSLGQAELLFEGDYNLSQFGHAHYDATPDGQRFVMVEEDREAFELLRLVLDWDQELRDR